MPSQTSNRTSVPQSTRWIFDPWTTREVLKVLLLWTAVQCGGQRSGRRAEGSPWLVLDLDGLCSLRTEDVLREGNWYLGRTSSHTQGLRKPLPIYGPRMKKCLRADTQGCLLCSSSWRSVFLWAVFLAPDEGKDRTYPSDNCRVSTREVRLIWVVLSAGKWERPNSVWIHQLYIHSVFTDDWKDNKGFPDGPVVKNAPRNSRDTGSIPDPGRSHVLRSN